MQRSPIKRLEATPAVGRLLVAENSDRVGGDSRAVPLSRLKTEAKTFPARGSGLLAFLIRKVLELTTMSPERAAKGGQPKQRITQEGFLRLSMESYPASESGAESSLFVRELRRRRGRRRRRRLEERSSVRSSTLTLRACS